MPGHSYTHFTRKKKSKKRKSKKRTSTRKQRKQKRGSSVNKYVRLAPKKKLYKAEDKRLRQLPLEGKPGEVKRKGLLVLFHGRRYRLQDDVVIPDFGKTFGNFELEKQE